MKYSKVISLILVFSLALTTVGCGKTDGSKYDKDGRTLPFVINEDPLYKPPVKITEEVQTPEYQEMTKASIWSTGNNYRLKKVIERLGNGEKINLVALGGSITEGQGATNWGDGYAYRFARKLAAKYGSGDNVNFINAGICGTPSSLGIMRYERDVLKIDEKEIVPDILIIEFAVNDGDEVTVGRAYEGIISRTLVENPDCAIIMLFSLSDTGFTLEDNMRPLGEYYNIPMVSMKSAYDTGAIEHDDYFTDSLHPADGGHELMANCLMELLREVKIEDEDLKDDPMSKVPFKSRDFTYMKLIQDDNNYPGLSIDWGSFDGTDVDIQMRHNEDGTTYYSFAHNYMNEGNGNESLVIKATCSKMLLCYKTDADEAFGTAEVYVDGQYFAPLQGSVPGMRNYCYTILVLDSDEYTEHTLEIKMADDSVGKWFTIYGIAYDYKDFN